MDHNGINISIFERLAGHHVGNRMIHYTNIVLIEW